MLPLWRSKAAIRGFRSAAVEVDVRRCCCLEQVETSDKRPDARYLDVEAEVERGQVDLALPDSWCSDYGPEIECAENELGRISLSHLRYLACLQAGKQRKDKEQRKRKGP